MMNFYKLRWDFKGVWEADILRGPRKVTTATCTISKLTSEKWARVSGVHTYTVDFNNATFADKKRVAMHFMKVYLQDLQKEMMVQ